MKQVKDLIEKIPSTMSQYQIENFVVQDKITDFRMLKQLLLELSVRYSNKENYELDLEEKEVELEKLKEELNNLFKRYDRKLKEIEIKRKKKEIESLNKTLKNLNYEIEIFENKFKEISKNYDDLETFLMDQKNEEIYWINKFIKEAQIDIMTTGRIGKGLLDAILMLPEKTQLTIIHNAIDQAMKSNLYLEQVEQETIKKAEQELLSGNEVRKLLLNNVLGEKRVDDE